MDCGGCGYSGTSRWDRLLDRPRYSFGSPCPQCQWIETTANLGLSENNQGVIFDQIDAFNDRLDFDSIVRRQRDAFLATTADLAATQDRYAYSLRGFLDREGRRLEIGLFRNIGGSFTEVSGEGYARSPIRLRASSTNCFSLENDTALSFPIALGLWGTLTKFGIFDARSGELLFQNDLSNNISVYQGDTVHISVGAVRVSF